MTVHVDITIFVSHDTGLFVTIQIQVKIVTRCKQTEIST